jgi:hypothetical protein
MWREIKILNTIVADKIQQQNYIPWGWWCGSSGTSKHNAVSSAPAPPKKKKKSKNYTTLPSGIYPMNQGWFAT